MHTMTRRTSEHSTEHATRARTLWPFHLGALADCIAGLGLIAFSKAIAATLLPAHEQLLGFATPSVLQFIGVILILFALETLLVARTSGPLKRFRPAIIAINWATALAALALAVLAFSALPGITVAVLVSMGLALAALATLQRRVP